jgi:hypothetical protein
MLPLAMLLMATSSSAAPAAATVLLLAMTLMTPASSTSMPRGAKVAIFHDMRDVGTVAAQRWESKSSAANRLKCETVKKVLQWGKGKG